MKAKYGSRDLNKESAVLNEKKFMLKQRFIEMKTHKNNKTKS